MTIWKDKQGALYDDMDGAMLGRPSWPAGCVKATQAEIDAYTASLVPALTYQQKRQAAYPPIADYLDAKVKQASADPVIVAAGVSQEAKYLADCAAVKLAIPKV